MKYLVAGTAKDITKTWESTKQSLSRIFEAVEEYKCVIVESNSEDDTLNVLQEWAAEDSRRTIISLGNLPEITRTKRIAQCRNEYLKHIKDEDFLLVVDLDNVLAIQENFKQQLETCFTRDDWDAVSSNRAGIYYDVWALRCEELGVIKDVFKSPKHIVISGWCKLLSEEEFYEKYVFSHQRHIEATRDWIECQSAFGGMTLYKVKSIMKKTYNGAVTCEHVSFNKTLRIFINPQFISG